MKSPRSTDARIRVRRWQRLLFNALLVLACGKMGVICLPDERALASMFFGVAFVCLFLVIDDLNWYVTQLF